METPKWLTNVFAGVGIVLAAFELTKPEIFNPEITEIIMTSANTIGYVILSVIAAFAAKDELKAKNFF